MVSQDVSPEISQNAATQPTGTGASGISIEEYCRINGESPSRVWTRISAGELAARWHDGRILLFSSNKEAVMQNQITPAGPVAATARPSSTAMGLPPLPPVHESLASSTRPGASRTESMDLELAAPTALENRPGSTDMALLLDHLSLAKEENREILRMTQEAIRRVSEMSDSIVSMKDAVIEAREAQIEAMASQIAAARAEILALKQQKEDLEILAREIMSAPTAGR